MSSHGIRTLEQSYDNYSVQVVGVGASKISLSYGFKYPIVEYLDLGNDNCHIDFGEAKDRCTLEHLGLKATNLSCL